MGEEKEPAYGLREQKKIVAILISDDKNFEDILSIIEPERFDNPPIQLLVKIIKEFYEKYNSKPEVTELLNEIDKLFQKNRKLPVDEIMNVFEDVLALLAKPEGLNYLREEFIDFAKVQKLKSVIYGGAEKFKKKSADELIDFMAKGIEEAKGIGKKDSADELQTVNLGDVKPEEVEWLWGNRIPLGKLSLIVGDPGGNGKLNS